MGHLKQHVSSLITKLVQYKAAIRQLGYRDSEQATERNS